jgi:ATP-dependent Lhr-like helicase
VDEDTAAVRRTLDFSLQATDGPEADAASRRPRRVRKPSRPLPLL